MWWDDRQPEPVSGPLAGTVEADGDQGKKTGKAPKKAKGQGQPAPAVEAAILHADPNDPVAANYGDAPLIQSQNTSGPVYTSLEQLGQHVGQQVLVRGRIHNTRGKGKSCFLELRQGANTVQALLFADKDVPPKLVSPAMVKYIQKIPRESVVDMEARVQVPGEPVTSCTISKLELLISSLHCISRAAPLPFDLADAARPEPEFQQEGCQYVRVNQDTRLDNRYVDLRTPANQAIFRVQSAVCQLFREALLRESFVEIHSPKLIAGASEGGASVFTLDYLGRPACLAQSPQLYKQMAICGGLERVFEIGPVFRAERSDTHRHLTEFTGLDLEMAINCHYSEVLDVLDRLFRHIFAGLQEQLGPELATIWRQYPCEPLQWLPQTLRLPFAEGITMLQQSGYEVDPLGDLNTEAERRLGQLVKEKYRTDFYILYRYPLAVRPFYTMPDPHDPAFSNSFDVFIRGEEIISGAQRVHVPSMLEERAKACGIDPEGIRAYIDSFQHGCPPHGGLGVGLERVVMLFCGLNNIRKTSMFPRDPRRLTP